MTFADALTGGTIGGTAGAVVVAVLCVVAIVVGRLLRGSSGDYGEGGFMIVSGAVVLVITLVVYVWSMWPFAYDYHHWVDKQVKVTAISSRILSDGDNGISQKFVVRDASGVFYGVQDTRAALVKAGDTLHLRCKKAYQYGIPRSADGWDCRWSR